MAEELKITGKIVLDADAAAKATEDITKKVEALKKELKGLEDTDPDFESKTNALKAFEKQLDQLSNPVKTVRAEIKELENTLIQQERGSKAFNETSIQIQGLKDNLVDVRKAGKETGGNLEKVGSQISGAFGKLKDGDLAGAGVQISKLAGSVKKINFKDVAQGAAGFGKSMAKLGSALSKNVVFLIAAAIALIILNFDKLTKSIPGFGKAADEVKGKWDEIAFSIGFGVNPAIIKSNKLAEEQKTKAEKQLQLIDDTTETLRRQGLTEEEIVALREEEIKKLVTSAKLNFENAKQNEADLIANKKRFREFASSAANVFAAVLTIPLKVIEYIFIGLEKLGAVSEDTVKKVQSIDLGKITGEFIFGTDADIEKQFKGETEKSEQEFKKAQNALDGLRNSEDKKRADKRKAANDKALKAEKEYNDKLLKLKEDLLKQVQDLENANKVEATTDEFEKRRITLQQEKEIFDQELKLKEDQINKLDGISKSEQFILDEIVRARAAFAESQRLANELIDSDQKKANEDTAKTYQEGVDAVNAAIDAGFKAKAEADNDFETLLGIDTDEVNAEFDKLIEDAKQFGVDTVAIEDERQRRLAEVKDKYAEDDTKRNEKEKLEAASLTTARIEGIKEWLDKVSEINDVLNVIDDNRIKAAEGNEAKQDKIRRQSFKRNKALNLAEAVTNTALAISKANTLIPVNVPAMIQAGIAGAAQIAKILATKYQGEGGGGGDTNTNPGALGAPVFQANLNRDLVGTAGGNRANTATNLNSRVYVVESDITTTQNRVKTIENRATIG